MKCTLHSGYFWNAPYSGILNSLILAGKFAVICVETQRADCLLGPLHVGFSALQVAKRPRDFAVLAENREFGTKTGSHPTASATIFCRQTRYSRRPRKLAALRFA